VPLFTASAFWGGREEKIFSAVTTIAVAMTFLSWWSTPNHLPPSPYITMVDVIYFAFLMVMALNSVRFWLSWAASFQLLAVLTHLIATFSHIAMWAYMTSLLIWSWLILAAFTLGLWDAWSKGRTVPGDPVKGLAP
jgi:phosphatidylserine synthase